MRERSFLFYFCVLASWLFLVSGQARAQESQPASAPSSQATSQPASVPAASSQPTSMARVDPWSGQEVTPLPKAPPEERSPKAAHMLAWLSFAGGLVLSTSGGAAFLGVEPGESRAPSLVMLGSGAALSVCGPSLGHLYAGEVKPAAKQIIFASLVVGGAVGVAEASYHLAAPLEDEPLRITLALLPLTIAGIYELQYAVRMAEDAPNAVKRMNIQRRKASLSLLPNSVALSF